MAETIKMLQSSQGRDTTLKIFEEILRQKLDVIFRQSPSLELTTIRNKDQSSVYSQPYQH